jgi:hypothetical protein
LVAGKGINLNEVQESQPYGWAYEDFTIYMKDGHCQKMCTHRSPKKGDDTFAFQRLEQLILVTLNY